MNHLRNKFTNKYKIQFNANFWTGMVIGWIVLIILGTLYSVIIAIDLGSL